MSSSPAILCNESKANEAADHLDEKFDVVDENNLPTTVASRQVCHEKGFLHRSTHVFIFRQSTGIDSHSASHEVLLQKRSRHKKVGSGLWDVSVAEHLSAGENFEAATIRGLNEEIKLTITPAELVCVRQPYLSKQSYPGASVIDNMFTTLFAAKYDEAVHGVPTVDEAEVQEVRWWPIDEVLTQMEKGEQVFTRWLLIELANIDLKSLSEQICKRK